MLIVQIHKDIWYLWFTPWSEILSCGYEAFAGFFLQFFAHLLVSGICLWLIVYFYFEHIVLEHKCW